MSNPYASGELPTMITVSTEKLEALFQEEMARWSALFVKLGQAREGAEHRLGEKHVFGLLNQAADLEYELTLDVVALDDVLEAMDHEGKIRDSLANASEEDK
jgi:hypothetical protein